MDKPTDPADDLRAASDADDPESRALREYERFLERGLSEHDALSDWLATERELRSRLRRPGATAPGFEPDDSGSA